MQQGVFFDTELVSRYVVGEKVRDITAAMGCSTRYVYKILALYDVPLRRGESQQLSDDTIVLLYSIGIPTRQLYKLTGRGSKYVYDLLKRRHVPPRRGV